MEHHRAFESYTADIVLAHVLVERLAPSLGDVKVVVLVVVESVEEPHVTMRGH